jgi:hypothetical protein
MASYFLKRKGQDPKALPLSIIHRYIPQNFGRSKECERLLEFVVVGLTVAYFLNT